MVIFFVYETTTQSVIFRHDGLLSSVLFAICGYIVISHLRSSGLVLDVGCYMNSVVVYFVQKTLFCSHIVLML